MTDPTLTREQLEELSTSNEFICATAVRDLARTALALLDVVEKLPKTADGVPIRPFMDLWVFSFNQVYQAKTFNRGCFDPAEGISVELTINDTPTSFGTSRIFSTEAAAIAARKAGGNND